MGALEAAVRFSAWAARPYAEQRLDEGALLIAEIGRPGLDHAAALSQLDGLAAEVWADLGPATRLLRPSQVGRRESAQRVLEAISGALARNHGFHGASEDYTNPRNSFLDETLARRVGLPITLSVIYLEVARRLGAPLEGVSSPVRFLTRWPLAADEGGPLYVDAFDGGAVMDAAEARETLLALVRALARRDARASYSPQWLAPCDTRQILTRMLTNLKLIYLQRGETALALEAVDRLTDLRPDLPDELRDRGLLRLAMGDALLAAADISAYLKRNPDAPDSARLLRRISSITEVRAKLN